MTYVSGKWDNMDKKVFLRRKNLFIGFLKKNGYYAIFKKAYIFVYNRRNFNEYIIDNSPLNLVTVVRISSKYRLKYYPPQEIKKLSNIDSHWMAYYSEEKNKKGKRITNLWTQLAVFSVILFFAIMFIFVFTRCVFLVLPLLISMVSMILILANNDTIARKAYQL